MEPEQNISDKQKLIALVQSEYGPTVLLLVKSCFANVPLIGDDQFKTIVNAVTIETQQQLLINLIKFMEEIKNGSLHE
jgi:hypothetical protein